MEVTFTESGERKEAIQLLIPKTSTVETGAIVEFSFYKYGRIYPIDTRTGDYVERVKD
jgi:hypothetical protein